MTKIRSASKSIPFKNILSLNPIKRALRNDPAILKADMEKYVKEGQKVADLGCGGGFYTLPLAACVGTKGKVFAVDLDSAAIRELDRKAKQQGLKNIETHAVSVAKLPFIQNGTIDFVLANGLLCTMPKHRQETVKEIRRILKSDGKAYLSLGGPRPIGHVSRAEWEEILSSFQVLQRGGFLQPWAFVIMK
jgi:ubiquinone/menaquinone biosynthesis C-methylase UbiE